MLHNKYIEELTWSEARDSVIAVNQSLVAAIDTLPIDDTYKVFKVRYAFGDKILKHGILQLQISMAS